MNPSEEKVMNIRGKCELVRGVFLVSCPPLLRCLRVYGSL